MRTKYRLGIDAGGTFTDFVLADNSGDVRLYKALSTPDDPTRAIENGLRLLSDDMGAAPAEIVAGCDLCINGTTVGLNALIQHKGAKVGLICTAGHEDSIEIRLGHKEEGYRYDSAYPPAVMLTPRYLRRGVRERVISDGTVRTALHEEDVRAACEFFLAEGVEAVAVSFLWSVLNPAHERRAAEIVREMMPDVVLTVGSELYPQIREYTRTSTAVTNAYLAPTLSRYVSAVDRYFKKLGAKYPVRYFQSNGGLAIGKAMTDRSVYAINSGPASAPQAGLFVAAPFAKANVITIDMGGTSFDITLTKDGATNINKNIDFLRYRIGVPMIQVETLGAGGGSIGWIDSMGLLQVGPQSAGADPGPACYGLGGTEPTVSDADLVLGYLNPDGLLGGKLPLDLEKARAAIKTAIADRLGISVERAAYGMYTIVNHNMVNGIRRVSVERGYDPRDFVLVGCGGGGAMHAAALADELHHAELRYSELSGRRNSIRERLEAEWRRPLEDMLATVAPLEVDDETLGTERDTLRQQLESLGPVNPLAIEEHEEEVKRLDFLTTQRADLASAKLSLQQAIREIDTTARELFLATFTQVRENFRQIFMTLFGGGECDLRLERPDAPLDCDIEIHASPRGKRTQRIHLLSSGERALVALSLLFGIFLTKPSPFCLLDEVDAPLDDANTLRFCELVKRMSAQTQFLFISHNKISMEMGEQLIGVTMPESGVSRVVAVDIDEALRIREELAA